MTVQSSDGRGLSDSSFPQNAEASALWEADRPKRGQKQMPKDSMGAGHLPPHAQCVSTKALTFLLNQGLFF